MAAPSIDRLNDRNLVGICHLDVVEVKSVVSEPEEFEGNLIGDYELADGVSWSRVYLDDNGGLFRDQWLTQNGSQYSAAQLTGNVAKDRLELMPHLWAMKGKRYIVLATNRNGDVLSMGRKETPAKITAPERTSGDDPDRDRNQYDILVEVTRRLPVPFYNGTVPEPEEPGVGGDGHFRTTDGGTVIADVPPDTNVDAPQSVTKYKDSANASQVTTPSDTEYSGGTLRGAAEIPRRAMKNTAGTGFDFVSVEDLLNDTVPNAPNVTVTRDGSPYGTPPAGTTFDVTSSGGDDGTVKTTDGATTVLTVSPGATENLPQSTIKYKNATNADAELAASNTEFDGTHLRPATRIPRRALKNSAGTSYDFVAVEDLVNDTVPTAPDVNIIDQDSNPVDDAPAGTNYAVLVFSGIDGGLSNTTYSNSIVAP